MFFSSLLAISWEGSTDVLQRTPIECRDAETVRVALINFLSQFKWHHYTVALGRMFCSDRTKIAHCILLHEMNLACSDVKRIQFC